MRNRIAGITVLAALLAVGLGGAVFAGGSVTAIEPSWSWALDECDGELAFAHFPNETGAPTLSLLVAFDKPVEIKHVVAIGGGALEEIVEVTPAVFAILVDVESKGLLEIGFTPCDAMIKGAWWFVSE